MRWCTVKSFYCCKEPFTGRHGRRQANIFRIERPIIRLFQLKDSTWTCWSYNDMGNPSYQEGAQTAQVMQECRLYTDKQPATLPDDTGLNSCRDW
jgi:hypothetical protein